LDEGMTIKARASKVFDLAGAPSRAVVFGDCMVIVSCEPSGWHLSISHPSRNPTWEEIRDARFQLLPANLTMAMLIPPKAEYVNLSEFCFHIFEVKMNA
jgi:hypothetical protein